MVSPHVSVDVGLAGLAASKGLAKLGFGDACTEVVPESKEDVDVGMSGVPRVVVVQVARS